MYRRINYKSIWHFILPFIFSSVIFPLNLYAVPAYDGLFKLKQPSGISFEARQRGDEWYNWIETKDGYGIYKNTATGNWEYYAPSDDPRAKGQGVVSKDTVRAVVGEVDPTSFGIPKGLRPIKKQLPVETSIIKKSEKTHVSGDIPLLVICVEYDDTPHTYSGSNIEDLFFGYGGNVSHYYGKASYYNVEFTRASETYNEEWTTDDGIIGWLQLHGNHPNTGTSTGKANQKIAKNAIIAADPYIDYASYDTDKDRTIIETELSIVIIVAGYEASTSGASSPSVWGHQGDMSDVGYPKVDGVTIKEYVQVGEKHANPNVHLATIGVMCHELGHLTFSLPDLYDTTPIHNGDSYGVGDFDLMGTGAWGAASTQEPGESPTLLSAWSREYLSWGTVYTVSSNQIISLPGTERNEDSIFRINTMYPIQYFLLENREFTGYDRGFERSAGASGHGGLVIYHIDESKMDMWTRWLPQINEVNADVNNKGVDVEEANELGTNTSMLDGKVSKANTNMFYFSENGNHPSFTDVTKPNSKLKNGLSTDISITDISEYGDTMTAKITRLITNAKEIAAGEYHTLAVNSDGTVWAWGANGSGELGNGTNTSFPNSTPVQITSINDITVVAGGSYHSMALSSDGSVWTWGANGIGQLGNGTTTNSNIPVQVSGLNGVVDVACGSRHSVALKSDGTVWTWGDNSLGQLGIWAFGPYYPLYATIPVQVCLEYDDEYPYPCKEHLSGIIAIACGLDHTLALKSDGTLLAWGSNSVGQLGNDSQFFNTNTPVPVSGLNNVIAITGGGGHSVALKSDGTVWTWGKNLSGQLGNGTTTNSNIPVQVSGLNDIIAIGAGTAHTMGIKSDGTIWTWGSNGSGQLGDGTRNNSNIPVQVNELSYAIAIGGGYGHTVSLRLDGTVWTWGANSGGQLGDGTTDMRITPEQININLGQTPTPSPTPTPSEECVNAENLEAEPTVITLGKMESDNVTVTVTGEDGCPAEGDTVKARVDEDGEKLIKVSPNKQRTDENGQAVFKIKAKNKTGSNTVTFKDGILSTTVNVMIVE